MLYSFATEPPILDTCAFGKRLFLDLKEMKNLII